MTLSTLFALCIFGVYLLSDASECPMKNEKVSRNLTEFMAKGRHIYAFEESSTAQLLLCTADLPSDVNNREVLFKRYTQGQSGNEVLKLKGTFVDFDHPEGPTIMLVSDQKGGPPFQSEILVYQDKNNTCGVFLVHALTTTEGGCYPEIPSSLCELRDTSNTTTAIQASDCYETFQKLCKPRPSNVNAITNDLWSCGKTKNNERCKPVTDWYENA
uniref:Lipocalin/cytosolic fatty-acid binding domain-containing protein n=1 Tax=Amblyomma maculatum TaxID=34609 RepID=G3MKH1_AMBMU